VTAIGFPIPEDITRIVAGLTRFLRSEVVTRHEKHAALLEDPRRRYGPDGRYVPAVVDLIQEVRAASADAGYFNLCVPTAMGGLGQGYLAYYVAWEAINRLCGAHHWLGTFALSHWAFGPSVVLEQLTPEARERALAGLVSGRRSMCFGLSEPGAGSDATMIETRATADGDGWRITGRKMWTTNVTFADWIVVFAVTDPARAAAKRGGISAFLVPTTAPGFTLQRVTLLQGDIGGVEGESTFDAVRVEPWQLVGALHEGFRIALLGVSLGRVYNAARAVGLARWALEKAVAYASQRVAFGAPIAEHQGVAFPLAESAMEVHAAHLAGLNAALLLDRGERAIKELSMAKAFSVEVCLRAVDRAIQTHGGMGLTNELGLVHAYNTLRIINIADGTNEILRRTIFQQLSRGDLDL
jgi:alkylation response protein AidB-like acyl-CoA dehydrogenase